MTALEDALRAADAIADRVLSTRHIPGVAYGIVAGGRLVHDRGVGTLRVGEDARPDADSVFRIASMTKSFTAATVLSLRDEGRLALDDPIAAHVPELGGLRGPTADAPAVTIRHLLTMAAGLATDDPWGDRQQGLDLGAFAELLHGPLTFAWTPGTRFEYSNLGYGILGRAITNVAGAEYRDVVRERILGPLGMDSTGFLREEVPVERLALGYLWRDDAYVEEPMDPYGALASMGGIFTSVRDLARWVAFLTDAWPPRDDSEPALPLSRASRREMQTAQGAWLPTVDAGLDGDPTLTSGGYGFGLFVEDGSRWGRIVRHSGGYPGFGSTMAWQPASGLGVIVLANHRYAPSTLLAREMLASLLASEAVPPRRLRPAPATTAARAAAERLLQGWDEDLATSLFAMNVELDEPLARRREAVERLAAMHGALRPDPELPDESWTPLDLDWWLTGELGGRVRISIGLSPESPPRVQTFGVTSVPDPTADLAAIGAGIVEAVNAPTPTMPAGITLAPGVDPTSLARAVRIAGARYAPVSLGPVIAGDGTASATWRLPGPHGILELEVERDPGTGLATTVRLRPHPTPPPRHDD
ncbi:MAG: beta-lactamase family protein [Chloroflexi bacterium]|nr:beta-lactamase family protein [Chloroflexota bacterium]